MEIQTNPYTSELLFFIERNLNSIVAILLGLLTIIVNILMFRHQLIHSRKTIKQESINRYNIEVKQKWLDELIINISKLISMIKHLDIVIGNINLEVKRRDTIDPEMLLQDEKLENLLNEAEKLMFELEIIENIIKLNLDTHDHKNIEILETLSAFNFLSSKLRDEKFTKEDVIIIQNDLDEVLNNLYSNFHELISEHKSSILK